MTAIIPKSFPRTILIPAFPWLISGGTPTGSPSHLLERSALLKLIPFHPTKFLLSMLICLICFPSWAQKTWPNTVLITNDNGIDDIKIRTLAEAFSKIATTYVIAPMKDRSGTTNYLTLPRRPQIKVKSHDWGQNLKVYSVDGYPADCVILGALGIMADQPPDLVVSGVNGGANLGIDWAFSGTIGAARTASLGGIPSMALSGLKSDLPGAMDAVNQWVVALAQSETVRKMPPNRYLTVSFPRSLPSDIKGVRFAQRSGLTYLPLFQAKATDQPGEWQWSITGQTPYGDKPKAGSDLALHEAGYITVVPMWVDEHDPSWAARLGNQATSLPAWPKPTH